MTYRLLRAIIQVGTAIGTLSIIGVLAATPVSAVETGGIGGRPANPREDNPRTKSIFIYDLEQGAQQKDGITIYNNASEKKTIAVYAVDATNGSGGSFACRQRVEERTGAGGWLKLDKEQLVLDAGQSETINFTVNVPAGAPAGEQDACIAIEDVSQTPTDSGNGVTLSTRSAIRVAVMVPGDIRKELTYTSVDASLKETKLNLSFGIRNTGNVSMDADMLISLEALVGGVTIREAGGTFPVLPNVETILNFDVDRPLFGGWYNLVATSHYNNDVNLSLGMGEKSSTVQRKTIIFVPPTLPGLIIEMVFLGLVVLVGAFVYRNRREHKLWAGKGQEYVVLQGDTVQSVAEAFALSWKDLARHNKLKAPFVITPGQTLQVLKSKKKPTRGRQKKSQ